MIEEVMQLTRGRMWSRSRWHATFKEPLAFRSLCWNRRLTYVLITTFAYFLASDNESSNCYGIETLHLKGSCNFDSDRACELLAELLTTAPIKLIDISNQVGTR